MLVGGSNNASSVPNRDSPDTGGGRPVSWRRTGLRSGKARISVVGVAALVGAKSSEAKARASRANGRLGGRAPKNAAHTNDSDEVIALRALLPGVVKAKAAAMRNRASIPISLLSPYFGGVIVRCAAALPRSSAARWSASDCSSNSADLSRFPRPLYARASCTCRLPS
jgi:hypothetical protein